MRDFLWLIPTLPFLGALTLITVGTRLSKQVAAPSRCKLIFLFWILNCLPLVEHMHKRYPHAPNDTKHTRYFRFYDLLIL